MGTKRSQDEWDEISFVISSTYRETVLRRLADGPTTPVHIAEESEIDLSHVSRSLTQLRDRSLVELLVSEDRQKGRLYGITDRGTEIWQLIEEMENEADAE